MMSAESAGITSCAADGDITQRLLDVIAKEGMVPREKLSPEATLEDLNIASIDLVTILMGIEEEFDVYLPVEGRLVEAKNIGDLVVALSEVIAAKSADTASHG